LAYAINQFNNFIPPLKQMVYRRIYYGQDIGGLFLGNNGKQIKKVIGA
jgi:hypothetical protein